MSHGTKSSTQGRLPQRLKRCRGGLQTAQLVRRKSRKDQLRASPLSKTVRKLRMTTKRMATRMTSLPVLQMIMLSLESSVKSNNLAAQQELVANRPP